MVLIVAVFVVLIASAASVETVMRGVVRTELQQVADAAALAGAGALVSSPGDQAGAQATALRFARMNLVRGRQPSMLPEDIVVNLDSATVRVRAAAAASPFPRVLSWILGGFESGNVWAVATAVGRAGRDGRPGEVVRLIQ